jgi:hypothetical protein
MIPVQQLRREENGDCLRSCLASLLELRADEVPDFSQFKDDPENPTSYPAFWLELQSFVKGYGYFFLEVQLTEKTPWMPLPFGALAIFMGYTKTNNRHAIVGLCEDGKFIPLHDPFHHSGGLTSIESVCFLVPLNPAAMALIEPSNIIRPPSHDSDSRS